MWPMQAYLLASLLFGSTLAFPSPYGRSIERRQTVAVTSASDGGSAFSSSSSSEISAGASGPGARAAGYYTAAGVTTQWGQCDGMDFQGPKQVCEMGCSCKTLNPWYSQCIPNRGWLCVQGLNATYSNVTGTSSGAKERASPVTVTANSGAKIAPVVVPQPSPIFQSSGSSTGSYAANPSGGTRCSSSSYSSSSGTRSSQNSSPSGCYSSSSSSNSGLPGTNAFFTQQSSSSGTQPGAAAKGEIPPIGGLPGALSFLQKPKGSEGIKGKKVEAVGEGDQVAVAEDEDVELAKRREDEDIELAKRRGDEAAELAKRKGDEALEKRREVLDRSMKKRNIRMRRGG